MTIPTEITLHQQSKQLEIAFDDGLRCQLPYEFLRVHSPSAEVRGHGPGQEVLQIGKQDVNVIGVEPVGSYALKIKFDDGHDTGLYTWEFIRHLGDHQEALWQEYLQRIEVSGASRHSGGAEKSVKMPGGKSCGSGAGHE
jgi:DUF971 family protein